ncbi:MAG: methionine adenosyltransferase, partial [Candidatus Marinimicrobia bacterium]|nr:methionine adenosyltransferase [Candidatus Neomarinimicrobiota bacterium]
GGAGDQGLMFGYACRETPEFMPMPIMLAHKLVHQQSSVRKDGILPWLGPDAKSQVTVEYVDGVPNSVKKIVLSTQHDPTIINHEIKKAITNYIITPVIPSHMINSNTQILINPGGRFEIGGPEADTGVTGRKIIVDTYGGSCPHGGGAFSGKDATKVDRSGAYMARFLAKNVVSKNIADRCTIQLSYAIGKANPVSLMVDFHGTGYKKEKEIEQSILENIDLTPSGIIDSLNLRTTNYKNTAAYGHFGNVKTNFPWEVVPEYFLC